MDIPPEKYKLPKLTKEKLQKSDQFSICLELGIKLTVNLINKELFSHTNSSKKQKNKNKNISHSFYEAKEIPLPKQDKDSTKKKYHRLISQCKNRQMHIDEKFLISSKPNLVIHKKKNNAHNQVKFVPGTWLIKHLKINQNNST